MGSASSGARKLTEDQKRDIFNAYVNCETNEERRTFEQRMAVKYEVNRSTINRILTDEKRVQRYLAREGRVLNIAWAKMYRHLLDAVQTQIDIMNDPNLPPNMYGLKQNAAESIMNRLGFKKEVAENNEIKVTVNCEGGLNLNMPSPSDE